MEPGAGFRRSGDGGFVKGAPVSREKFNLICLAVCAVLPFQFEQILKKR